MSSSSSAKILLRGGNLLLHNEEGHVIPAISDLLIEGDSIAKIASHIDIQQGEAEVIDCAGKIISPSFIRSHHHLCQTQLKGQHGNDT
jgi:cytosine/adenosine deaminase-related metal-dependent hydrolase